MRKLSMIVVAILVAGPAVFAAAARADMATPEQATAEKVLGDPNAPVTIQAFESLSCPHCATFHAEAWPQIKEQYVDTGQAKFVYNDFPLNEPAMVAAMAARCVPPDRYFGMIEMLYRTQDTWLRSPDPREAIKQTVRLGGLTADEFEQCVNNQALFDHIQGAQNAAAAEHDINSTPTFLIDGQRISGAQPFDEFQAAIEDARAGGGAAGGSMGNWAIIVVLGVAAVAAGGYVVWRRQRRAG